MPRLKSDPLLTAARLALMLIGGIILFALVLLVIGIVAVLTVERADLMAQVATFDAPPSLFWLVVAAMILIAALLAATAHFIRLLFRIVASVDLGDPFIPVNADRLAQMGWLTVAVQIGFAILWAMAQIVETYVDETGGPSEISLSGWLLALVLFILARIFRHGTDLRAEVDGTI